MCLCMDLFGFMLLEVCSSGICRCLSFAKLGMFLSIYFLNTSLSPLFFFLPVAIISLLKKMFIVERITNVPF